MARGILVTFSGYPSDAACLMPDVGLASLAGTLLSHGHEVLVLDFNSADTLRKLTPPELTRRLSQLLPTLDGEPDADTLAAIRELTQAMEERLLILSEEIAAQISLAIEVQHSQFVGFKLWSGDGFVCCSRVAEHLRERYPGLRLYAGGPAVLFAEETIFRHTSAFDVLVDGEGEEAILGLALHAEKGESLADVPNLIIRTDAGYVRTRQSVVTELDRLPFPAYDPAVYPSLAADEQQLRIFVLDDSRGCYNACRFCISRHGTGASWRAKSPARVVQEMERLSSRYGTSIFRLGGNSTPAPYLDQLAIEVERQGLRPAYSAYTTVSGFARSLDRIAASGCRTLFLGVESFAQDDLVRLNKTHTPPQAVAAVKACIDAGIVPLVSLIVPAPGQSAAAIETNRKVALEICGNQPAVVIAQYAAVLPRTDWWREPAKYGFHLRADPDQYRLRQATWKVRHIIPPTFWPPQPYTYDGMEFATFSAINAQFQRDLSKGGVVVNLSNEAMMMAAPAGRSPAELQRDFRRMIFTQDAEQMAAFIQTVNHGMASGTGRAEGPRWDGLCGHRPMQRGSGSFDAAG